MIEKILILAAAAVACEPGDVLVDFSNHALPGTTSAQVIIQVLPPNTHVIVYPPGRFGEGQRCCGGKPNLPYVIPMVDRKLCVREGQPPIKWELMFRNDPGI